MSLEIKYERLEDARMRLRGTVVLYEGNPVYIRDIAAGRGGDEIFRVHADKLPLGRGDDPFERGGMVDPEGAEMRKYISSKKFDISPFKMGYVNAPTGAFFCSRLPHRQQKQGLSGETFNTFLRTKEVVEMVNNRYPTFDQALKALAKAPSVAFSREFALSKDEVVDCLFFLYHKGQKVGAFASGKIGLGAKFVCLKEALVELGVPLN
jgi:hypothetical protein